MIYRPCQSLAIVPRHPFRGAGGQFPGVALSLDQVVERVGAAQLASMDPAHEQVADLCAVQSAINRAFFRCKTARFSNLSTMLLSSGAPALRRNNVKGFRCR